MSWQWVILILGIVFAMVIIVGIAAYISTFRNDTDGI